MSFLKDLKEDLSQAVNELASETKSVSEDSLDESDDVMVNTLLDSDGFDDEELGDLESLNEDTEFDDYRVDLEDENLDNDLTNDLEEDDELDIEDDTEFDFSTIVPEKDTILKEEKAIEEVEEVSDEVTEITKGSIIEGNLKSNGSINVYGKIIGDIECKGKLVITGSVVGKSKASEIFANNSKIEGDMESTGSIKIGNGSVIIGNIHASSSVVGGAVKGDIDVKGPVIVDATAVVQGNIKSRTVQINNGAAIDGYCSQCYADIDYKTVFDEVFSK